MRSFRTKINDRRRAFLLLAGEIERQLREAYDRRFQAGGTNQVSLAKKLGVGRWEINKRLNGHRNMTLETVADMVWALGHAIKVDIYDPQAVSRTNYAPQSVPSPKAGTSSISPAAPSAQIQKPIAGTDPKLVELVN